MTDKQTRILLGISLMCAISLANFTALTGAFAAQGSDDGNSLPPKQLDVVNFITWWSHDATGYHPAIMVNLENVSERDLTGLAERFQARFTDVRNGFVTVARTEKRWENKPNQQSTITLTGPSAFELPIDYNSWPSMECKLMCRLGEVDDSGTQNLLLTSVEKQTMPDDEAASKLAKLPDLLRVRNQMTQTSKKSNRPREVESEGPQIALAATSLSLNSPPSKAAHQTNNKSPLIKFCNLPKVAGLGDDFYLFEQSYKEPTSVDAHDKWTWVRYVRNDPTLEVYAAAKAQKSTADIVVVKVPAEEVTSEAQIVQLARTLSGKLKSQPLEHMRKSVKYLPNGRVAISYLDAAGYRCLFINPRSASAQDNNYIIAISRLQGDLTSIMADVIKRSSMMRFLSPLIGDPAQD